jgi:hypothetical protein
MRTRRLAAAALGLTAGLLLASPALAMYIQQEIGKVPVDRLVKNLEELVKKDPKDVKTLNNLARANAMAYALKTETAEVRKGKEEDGVWFGYEPKYVPFSKVEKTDDADMQKAAKAHLDAAIDRYKQAVALAPDDLGIRLGSAWTVEQSGDKDAAIKEYRSLLEEAWKKEKDWTALPLGGRTITGEAAGYFTPLLDPDKDKDEIAMWNERAAKLNKLPRPITPIAVPLRDGLGARDIEDGDAAVAFDADGSGLKRKWTWITKDAGWLVYDPRGKGEIGSGLQLFGNVTFWLFWDTGYDALAALDDNGDGVLTGDELRGLAIWHDANGDGVCDPGEVRPLSDYGITAVSCRFERDPNHPDRIAFSPRGVTFRDGTTRPTFDLVLKRRDGK